MISVVVPIYNKAHTIVDTLKTVLQQSLTDFEVVLVDDGSIDNSVAVIQQFLLDKRFKLVSQSNQGVSAARNFGVENSKYNYIAFLDGDDEWLSDYLAKMKAAIDLFPKSEMFCSAGLGRSGDGVISRRQIDKYDGKVTSFNFFENPHVFLHIGATIVTKQLFDKVSGFPAGMKRNEDFAFLYSAALHTQPIYSGFPLSIYVGDVEGQATRESIYENQTLLDDIIKRYNVVYGNWIKSGSNNASFIVFMKYELRHFFMINIYNNQFATNAYFLNNLNRAIISHFNYLDKRILNDSIPKKMAILYFKFTKLKWMLNGYQRVK